MIGLPLMHLMENEKWIVYGPSYEVSDLGRVRSVDRIVNGRGGSRYVLKGKIHVGKLTKDGYHKVFVYRKLVSVHRMVAEAFIANPEKKPQVNHLNGVKTDNRCGNLEWVTSGENQNHSYASGLRTRRLGINTPKAKLDPIKIKMIRSDDRPSRVLAGEFGVTKSTILRIKSKKIWEWVK